MRIGQSALDGNGPVEQFGADCEAADLNCNERSSDTVQTTGGTLIPVSRQGFAMRQATLRFQALAGREVGTQS